MNLALKSSPGFREKLAEREEAISLFRVLFRNGFFRTLNIRTIEITADNPRVGYPLVGQLKKIGGSSLPEGAEKWS